MPSLGNRLFFLKYAEGLAPSVAKNMGGSPRPPCVQRARFKFSLSTPRMCVQLHTAINCLTKRVPLVYLLTALGVQLFREVELLPIREPALWLRSVVGISYHISGKCWIRDAKYL